MKLTSVLSYGGKRRLVIGGHHLKKYLKIRPYIERYLACLYIMGYIGTVLQRVWLTFLFERCRQPNIERVKLVIFICLCLSHFRTAAWSKTRYIFPFRWLVDMRWYWICAHLLINRWHQRAYLYKSIPYCLGKMNQFWLLIPRRIRSQLSSRWPMFITVSFMECFGEKKPSSSFEFVKQFGLCKLIFIYLYPLFLCHFKTYYVKAVYVTWNWHVF
jgi:hypothetical protein